MTQETKTLQEEMIRHLKGILNSWEKWLKAQTA